MGRKRQHAKPSSPSPSFGKVGVPGARRGARWSAPCGGAPHASHTLRCRQPRRRDGPEHGAAHPRPACPLPSGNPGAALRRGERPPLPESSGYCRLRQRPRPPLRRHHIALSPSNAPRAPRLAGPRPRPRAPAPGLGAGPGLRVPPQRPFPLCAAVARAGAPQAGVARPVPAPAAPPRLSPSRGAGAAVAPQCAQPRAGGTETRRVPRPRWVGAAPSPAKPARGQPLLPPSPPLLPPRSARPSAASSTGRAGRSWRGAAGRGARLGPPRLMRAPSSRGAAPAGRGWHHPGAGSGRPCPGSHWTAARSKLSAHVAWPPEEATP